MNHVTVFRNRKSTFGTFFVALDVFCNFKKQCAYHWACFHIQSNMESFGVETFACCNDVSLYCCMHCVNNWNNFIIINKVMKLNTGRAMQNWVCWNTRRRFMFQHTSFVNFLDISIERDTDGLNYYFYQKIHTVADT